MMLLWLISLAFYPSADASCDIFLSAVELGRYRQAPTYCRFLGIPSTWLGIGVYVNYIGGLGLPRPRIVLHP
jgi:hypothetical protein